MGIFGNMGIFLAQRFLDGSHLWLDWVWHGMDVMIVMEKSVNR
jgi:hypothetical protein